MKDWHNHTDVADSQIIVVHQALDVILNNAATQRITESFLAIGMIMVKQRGLA
ncbi:hypothetical protein MTR_6g034520 [Medicago truncatula]|uniref:Uncharacterized protein n=1 Tax=Medicago truncatula TaxID=3880 RepID=G7KIJ7_MEDTR|nr:hypothetical protein MTR_6g034520 [Medicago truncatula]